MASTTKKTNYNRVATVKYICDNIMIIRDEYLDKIYPGLVTLVHQDDNVNDDNEDKQNNTDDGVDGSAEVPDKDDVVADIGTDEVVVEVADEVADEVIVAKSAKTKFIADNLKYFDDKTIKLISKEISNSLSHKETSNEKRIRIALEITNQILKKFNLDPVYDLCDFKNFTRNDMLSQDCIDVIDENRDYIFKNGFTKAKCGAYQTLAYPHLSVFKGVLNQAGYELWSKSKNTAIKRVRIVKTIYYIQKKLD